MFLAALAKVVSERWWVEGFFWWNWGNLSNGSTFPPVLVPNESDMKIVTEYDYPDPPEDDPNKYKLDTFEEYENKFYDWMTGPDVGDIFWEHYSERYTPLGKDAEALLYIMFWGIQGLTMP